MSMDRLTDIHDEGRKHFTWLARTRLVFGGMYTPAIYGEEMQRARSKKLLDVSTLQ